MGDERIGGQDWLGKVTATVAAAAVVASLGVAARAWTAVERLPSSLDRIDARLLAVEAQSDGTARVVNDHLVSYGRHEAWGAEWVQGAARRMAECESRVSRHHDEIRQDVKELEKRVNVLFSRWALMQKNGNSGDNWSH